MEENKKPQNPNAFAMCDENGFTQYGMTLRDYFAAKAISNVDISDINQGFETVIAKRAYLLADAMLKKREL